MKNEHLVELEKSCERFLWIHDQAAMSENGLHCTVYHDYGGGSLILRDCLEHSHPESKAGLQRQARQLGWR